MSVEECPFKVVRTNGTDEVLARAANLLIGRAAYETARRLSPKDQIEYRRGAQVIECSNLNTPRLVSTRQLRKTLRDLLSKVCELHGKRLQPSSMRRGREVPISEKATRACAYVATATDIASRGIELLPSIILSVGNAMSDSSEVD
jgi:hypothetical protein